MSARSQTRNLFYLILVVALFVATYAAAEDTIRVSKVYGKALIREGGDYLWKKSKVGQVLGAGDHLQLRTGEARIEMGPAVLRIKNVGRIEVPLLDGERAGPWNRDLVLLIGNYSLDTEGMQQPLKLIAPFNEVYVSEDAHLRMKVTASETTLLVLTGKVDVRHRWVRGNPQASIGAGSIAIISAKGIHKKRPGALAVRTSTSGR